MGSRVFNRADNQRYLRGRAHHFQFKLFPAQYRFLNQYLMNWRSSRPAANDLFELFGIVGNATTGATEGVKEEV
jgi:hypothetical protein